MRRNWSLTQLYCNLFWQTLAMIFAVVRFVIHGVHLRGFALGVRVTHLGDRRHWLIVLPGAENRVEGAAWLLIWMKVNATGARELSRVAGSGCRWWCAAAAAECKTILVSLLLKDEGLNMSAYLCVTMWGGKICSKWWIAYIDGQVTC